ncbi:hypothetical protein PV433_18360 [Paenibacillus sp. GYB004]|uniref:hypothetical protein n=1 Tax=Paenibacillus sp. GYB004 TaxID=2994393 RepID=UPI002F962C60
MAKNYLELGPAPYEEDCAHVRISVDYKPAMRDECMRFMELLKKIHVKPPEGAYYTIKWNSHDYGPYADIGIVFDDENEEHLEYAFKVESNMPAHWNHGLLAV